MLAISCAEYVVEKNCQSLPWNTTVKKESIFLLCFIFVLVYSQPCLRSSSSDTSGFQPPKSEIRRLIESDPSKK